MKTRNYMIKSFLGGVFFIGVGGANAQLESGLLSYWNFNDNLEDQAALIADTAGTTADTAVINGGVTFAAGPTPTFGQSVSFDGVAGSFITVADPDEFTNDIDRSGADVSVSVWFQAESWTRRWQAMVAHGEGADYRIARRSNNNPIGFASSAGGPDIFTTTTFGDAPEGDGLWHHIVITTEEGGESRLYVDGVLEGVSADSISIAENGEDATNQLMIGGNPEVGNREFNGLIDEVAIWDRALTEDEISLIFEGGTQGLALSELIEPDVLDSDSDGLPDFWEIIFGLDPNSDVGDDGADGNLDEDSLTNLQEFQLNTSPLLSDTDGDGLNDDEEPNSDPTIFDTDGDTLSDGEEFTLGTNPQLGDSDFDTLPDAYEANNGLDPLADDTTLDADGDTLTNLEEFEMGTNPQEADSDNDLLDDNEEIDLGTDPLNADSDGDTLLDGEETTDTNTDPLEADSDTDGVNDNVEIALGTDPNDENSIPGTVSLPIFDDFEDGSVDLNIWSTLMGTVSQDATGATLGGSVSEADGDLVLESRGYLFTRAEYDPELTAGLRITGELTFGVGVDILSIVTRSDATSVARFGEVNSGIRFNFDGNNDVIAIDARNGDHVIENTVIEGEIDYQTNVVYTFTVIDDGEGGLFAEITDRDTPENTVSISADLVSDTSDSNHVVFYNREGPRDSTFQEISITPLLVPVTPEVANIDLDLESNLITLTWASNAGLTYNILGSSDLTGFPSLLEDGIVGVEGETTMTFPNPAGDADRFFFQVEIEQ